MPARATAIELTGAIYEAVLRPTLWPDALAQVGKSLSATSTALFFLDSHSNHAGLVVGGRLDDRFVSAYRDGFWKCDVWNERLSQVSPARPVTSEALVETHTLLHTEFYRGLLKPHDIFHAACGTVLRNGSESVVFRAHRPGRLRRAGSRPPGR